MGDTKLDDALLSMFIEGFYGYGTYQADYWFIGMEERGGDTFVDIHQRLIAWETRGSHELEDVAEFHRALGITSLSGGRPKLQPTWNRLIRIALSAEGGPVTTETVRRYQGQRLGRPDGNTALLELLPLPAPSVCHWPYREWSSLPYLAERDSYRNLLAPRRATYLRQQIQVYRPRAVIFYSTDGRYRYWWRTIAGMEMARQEVDGTPLYVGHNAHTIFLTTPHPVARGLSHRYFHAAGRLISGMYGGL